jgi:hypothetical protein
VEDVCGVDVLYVRNVLLFRNHDLSREVVNIEKRGCEYREEGGRRGRSVKWDIPSTHTKSDI